MSEARYLVGDVFERMAELPDGSIDLIVTSPPFLALRSYLPADHPDKGKELGSEPTPADFLTTLLALTAEWRRVLAPHGSLCVELGDTYSGNGDPGWERTIKPEHRSVGRMRGGTGDGRSRDMSVGWPLDKSLCLIPTLYPASLAYGRNLLTGEPCEPWRIRNQIVWHRPNPPVGALGDKVRPSTSYITVACTSRTRWFDLDAERGTTTGPRSGETREYVGDKRALNLDGGRLGPFTADMADAGAPPLDAWFDTTTEDVWTIPTQPYKGSHYATFPPALPRKLINLMCPRQVCRECREPRRRITNQVACLDGVPLTKRVDASARDKGAAYGFDHNRLSTQIETLGWTDCECRCTCEGDQDMQGGHCARWRRGVVCDPFAGSGTTLVAASELGRDSIGIDIDHRNLDLARQRCGMFLVEEDEVPA